MRLKIKLILTNHELNSFLIPESIYIFSSSLLNWSTIESLMGFSSLFFWLCMQHTEVPRSGIKPEPQEWQRQISLTCCAIRDFHRTFFLWTISLGEMPMLFLSHSTVALLCSSMGLCNPQHQSSCWVDILGREYLVPISAFSIHL